MEGLRVSKLEEGQQWGKNTSSKDKDHWGRRPPFIGGKKSNRYAHSLHRAVLPLVLTVLPLGVAVLPLRVAVLKKYIRAYHRWTCDEFLVRSGTTAVVAAVVPLWSGSKKLHPLLSAVVPLQPFQNTKTATTSANGLQIQRNQVCWEASDKG